MTRLIHLTLADARDGLKRRDFSATELLKAHIERQDSLAHLNAIVLKTHDHALAMAAASDERLTKGEGRPLEGIPVAVKDLYCTKDVKTQAGSRILDGFTPPYESTVTQNLWNAGAIMLGKTNMDEFAMGSTNLTSCHGPALNPWRRNDDPSIDLVPGGSSGGSAAIVAAYGAMGATGSDTGGSIRQPAAFCGIVGIKPTYGLCSRFGMVAFASSLDQAGPMTRTVRDAAIMLTHMAGHDPKDSTSLQRPFHDYETDITGNIRGLRVGVPREYNVEGMAQDIKTTWEKTCRWLEDAGAEIVEISLPHTKYALPCYYIIAPAEASSNLARYDGVRYGLRVEGHSIDEMYENTRAEGFGDEVKRRILIGTYVLSSGYYDAYYKRAQSVRQLIYHDFHNAFQDIDVICCPSTPTAAFGMHETPSDPVSVYLNDVYTVSVNLAGLPAMSIPVGLNAQGLPLGIQLIGPHLGEGILFRAGSIIEQAANFNFLPHN